MRLRRGVFHSVPELIAALEKCIDQHNREPEPFIWTAKANDILARATRARKNYPSGIRFINLEGLQRLPTALEPGDLHGLRDPG